MGFFSGQSDIPDSDKPALPEEENAVLDKLAHKVVDKGWTVPAILFLESVKPLNYISSQAMVFFEPIVQSVFNFRDYDTLRTALERRETLEILLLKIEDYDAVSLVREKKVKAFLKTERKKWKWYQRWLGIMTPKVELPEEVLKTEDTAENKSAGN